MALQDVTVPDLGDFKDVPVIDVLVKPGQTIKAEESLVTLESDKATMDVPAPFAGVVREVLVKKGDKLSKGSLVARVEAAEGGKPAPAAEKAPGTPAPAAGKSTPVEQAKPEKPFQDAQAKSEEKPEDPARAWEKPATPPARPQPPAGTAPIDEAGFRAAHAGPSVRKLARELGVDLARVAGTGPKGRILHADVQGFVKQALSGAAPVAGGPGLAVAAWPRVDFAKFGPVETVPLTRIQKIAGPGLHRNWVSIPHVTNHDDADVTELEAFRVRLNEENAKSGVKVTLLAFLMKACVSALQKFPTFNSSLEGDHLILKRYFHLGFAADTPGGLMVPVVKDVDKKGVLAIAKETSELAAKARDGKLGPGDMQGATFTISSLGGIGGTYFTPIINAPEVAILGVCRAAMKPVWDGKTFAPRLILPLSLSWDHRVVDGAAAARFNAHLALVLGDARRLLL